MQIWYIVVIIIPKYYIYIKTIHYLNFDFLFYYYILLSYVPSQADSVVYAALSGAPSADLVHALRWFNHISSYNEGERKG